MLRKLPQVQREFICTQHLHVVASSIAKPPVDAFVSVVTADARSMVNLVCLFMKPHLLALLQDNCLDLLRCAFLRKLSGCVRNITVFCQLLLRPIISAVLADTDISVKPKHRPIYRSISIRNTSVYPQIALKKQPAMSRTRHKLSNCVENEIEFFDLKAFQTHVHIGISRT